MSSRVLHSPSDGQYIEGLDSVRVRTLFRRTVHLHRADLDGVSVCDTIFSDLSSNCFGVLS